MKRSDFIGWDEDTKQVTSPGDVQLNRLVNTITVKNSGTVNLYSNNDLILPNTWKSYGGEPRSVYLGTIELRWIMQSPAPTPAIQEATVTQIFYVDKDV